MTSKEFNRTDHLANERTFLAWIRTNLGIMAFGFVVEKFSFFIREITFFLSKTQMPEPSSTRYSSMLGISLIAIGALLCVFAFLKFKKTEKEIREGTVYRSPLWLNRLLALLVFFIGVILIVYLITSSAK